MKLFDKIARKFGFRPEPTYTVRAVVHRADGTIEDLGVVGKARGVFVPTTNSKDK